jgi:hypothetical protein
LNNELQQSVANAVNHPTSAASVSVATIGTGVSTFLEIIPPLLGVVASILGIVLSLLLARNYIKRWRLMDMDIKLKEQQLQEIEDRKNGN